MLAVGGDTCIAVSCALTTIVLVPVTPPNCAEITAFPAATALTLPVLSTEATPEFDELQVALSVITWVVPSLSVAVATQSTKVFGAISAVAGVTEIAETVAVLTVRGAEPVTPLKVAVMLAVPGLTATAVGAEAIVATAVLSEFHVTSSVMFWTLPSLNRPAALKSKVVATAMLCDAGVTLMDTIVAFVTVNGVDPVTEPRVAVTVVVPALSPLDSPVLMIWSTEVSDDAQSTCRVKF